MSFYCQIFGYSYNDEDEENNPVIIAEYLKKGSLDKYISPIKK